MPYCNAIPVPPGGLKAIANYLADPNHEHHQEYEVGSMTLLGSSSVENAVQLICKSYLANKTRRGRGRLGRPPKNAASWYVIRVSDQSWLSAEEERAIEQAIIDEGGHGRLVTGIMVWHRNRLSGASDLNLLAAAFSPVGKRLRDRDRHPIKSLRSRIDTVVDQLNLQRRDLGIHPIQTMQEVQREKRKRAKVVDLAEELARMPKPPRRLADLEASLIAIGCEITRFNPSKDSVSVKRTGAKKATRLSITRLLNDVHQVILKLKKPVVDLEGNIKKQGPVASIQEPSEILSPALPSIRKKKKEKKKQQPSMG